MHESEKWKWSCSVVSDPQRPHGLQPIRLLRPRDFPGKSTGVGCQSNVTLRCRPKRNKSMSLQKLVHPSSQQHCSKQPEGWDDLNGHISGWMDKHHVSSHKTEYRLTVRSNKVLVYTVTWMNPSFFRKQVVILFYLFLPALSLCCFARAFSSCGRGWGLLFIAVLWASQALGVRASVVVTLGLSCPSTYEIIPGKGSNPCHLVGRQILFHCFHQGSPTWINLQNIVLVKEASYKTPHITWVH